MAMLDRRSLLRSAAAGAVIGGPFAGFVARAASADTGRASANNLGPVPDARDGQVRLWLPEGFQYRSFHDTETPVILDDGTKLPGRHDGMAAFAGPGDSVYLVRNHEVNGPGAAFGPGAPYDAMAQGGTATVTGRSGRTTRVRSCSSWFTSQRGPTRSIFRTTSPPARTAR